MKKQPTPNIFNCVDCIENPPEKCFTDFAAKNAYLKLENQRLKKELSVAAEKERRTIASELHDSIGQRLFAWRLKIAMASKSSDLTAIREALNPVAAELTDVSNEIRTLILELTPPALTEFGISAATKDLINRTATPSDLHLSFSEAGDPCPLSDIAVALLYRSVRELVLNATKHSGGTEATVALSWKSDHVQIIVSDNGIGFDRSIDQCPVGLGLFSIREHLDALKGRMQIITAPSQGLTAILTVPTEHGL